MAGHRHLHLPCSESEFLCQILIIAESSPGSVTKYLFPSSVFSLGVFFKPLESSQILQDAFPVY